MSTNSRNARRSQAKPPSGRRIVQLDGVGEVLLEKSSRAKRIHLTVRPFKGVRVAIPRWASYADAVAAAQDHIGWITKQLERVRRMEQAAIPVKRPSFFNAAVTKKLIAERLQDLANQHGLIYNRLFVRNQKTRWGSCSAKNNINLNVHLFFLPDELRDYVMLHELVHTRVKHHGPEFWSALEALIPQARQLDAELNRYEIVPEKHQISPCMNQNCPPKKAP